MGYGLRAFLLLKCVLLAIGCIPSLAQNVQSKADALFVNGNILTGEGIESDSPKRVSAVALRDRVIVASGNDREILKLRTSGTEVIDLHKAFVMAGFNDAHIHLASGGFEKLNVDLVGVSSIEEMKERIAAHVSAAAPGEWIRGRGWDHTKWKQQILPTRQGLDDVTGDHPAIFTRVDGHIAVANSAALKVAHVTKETPDPEGGKIDRDTSGEPTGILREGAGDAVYSAIPKPSLAERRKAVELALAEAARWGLTSVQDNSGWDDFLVYEDLEHEGKLTVRITEWLPFDASLETLERQRSHHDANDPMLHTGMLKGFLDGSLGSRTAALLQPYSDDPGNSGLPQYDQGTLNNMTEERVAAGFQIGFHAIGDRALEMALDAFEEVEKKEGLRDFRFRIEHAQVTTPEQIHRFREAWMTASMQPNHLLTDMNWAVARIGTDRASTSYAWKSFLNAGVPLAFGTDYPVEPLTPFRGLYAAVTRKNETGTKEYFPQEKLTVEEAIAAYTTGAAYAEFAESKKGRLLPGYLADFVVLDRDITQIPPAEILQTNVLRTVVGGKTVWQADQSQQEKEAVNLVGSVAPPFTVSTLDDKPVSLADYRGRALLINFWATWCEPCRQEMPWLAELREQYASRGFEVLGILTDNAPGEKVAALLAKDGVEYPILMCNHKTAQDYGGLPELPKSFFINSDGVVVAEMSGADSKAEIEANIRRALATSPKSRPSEPGKKEQ
jgi:predicted amidohydrolase YtcJ/peroxiredoxin